MRDSLLADLPQNRPRFGGRVCRFGDGPAYHYVARSRSDGFGGGDYSDLIGMASTWRPNAGSDEREFVAQFDTHTGGLPG